jgi:hypothetical protein
VGEKAPDVRGVALDFPRPRAGEELTERRQLADEQYAPGG